MLRCKKSYYPWLRYFNPILVISLTFFYSCMEFDNLGESYQHHGKWNIDFQIWMYHISFLIASWHCKVRTLQKKKFLYNVQIKWNEWKYVLFRSNIQQFSTIEFIGVILFNDKYSKVSFLRKTPLISALNFICNYLIGDFYLHCLHYCFDDCIWLAKIQEVA